MTTNLAKLCKVFIKFGFKRFHVIFDGINGIYNQGYKLLFNLSHILQFYYD